MLDGGPNLEALSSSVIGAAIEVHRQLGAGLLESAYQTCLATGPRPATRGEPLVTTSPRSPAALRALRGENTKPRSG